MTTQYLNDHDYQNYGPEMISVSQRAALEAVAPALQNLQSQNAALQQRLAVESRRRLDDQVNRMVPDLRQVDADPRWHRWLLGIDVLSGRVRQQLLNDAISHSDAGRVKQFFDQFKREAGAQSSAPDTARPTPSRSRSAPLGSRFYTRDQISELYSKHRRGQFSEATWAAQEADIMAAAREGRVRNPMDWAGK